MFAQDTLGCIKLRSGAYPTPPPLGVVDKGLLCFLVVEYHMPGKFSTTEPQSIVPNKGLINPHGP